MDIDDSKLDELDALYASDEDKKFKNAKKKKNKGGNKKDNVPMDNSVQVSVSETKDQSEETKHENKEGTDVVESTVKSAAQKKKEKKEREKQKKVQEKAKQQASQKNEGADNCEVMQAPTSSGVSDLPSKDDGNENTSKTETNEKGKKKKKPEKKKEETKEEAKEKARAKRAAMVKGHLAKLKEEEERLKREEEEAERKRQEFLRQKEEQEKIEKERRERKKQKEKERKQRLKEEGKLLTDKQKQDRRRLQEMLEARGLDLNEQTEEKKKRPKYDKPKKRNLQKQRSNEGDDVHKEANGEEASKTEADVNDEQEQNDNKDVADDWEAEDDWEKISVKSEETDDKKISDEEESEDEEDDLEEECDSSSDKENDIDESEDESEPERDPIEIARERIKLHHEKCEAARTEDNLRAAVVCVLGHVDTGKTKILDKLRHTNVQDGEAGGITQQIGATNVPSENIKEATKMCKEFQARPMKLPGLLIIDTPGHESFSNLRSRGSSLCDLAILVVDLMHGLEPQTIESIKLLVKRKTPFVVALNKIDRLYQWQSNPNLCVKDVLKNQRKETYSEFDDRLKKSIADFAMQEINAKLFYENPDINEYVSMVPTSAHSGDGMGDLLAYLCEYAETHLSQRLSLSEELQATVMEVKEIHGLGTTIDVILVNGSLHEGETIILAGQEGPIVTQIRGLLMPAPMKELRVKNHYDRIKTLHAAQGVKIIAKDLEKALAGLPLYASSHPAEIEYYKEEAKRGLATILKGISVSDIGVYVQASTLGSLEALLIFLRSQKIPYSSINIGPIHKRDVMKASVMVEREPKWAVILAFDVKVEREAQELADTSGVRIFTADIIYHLHDNLLAYLDDLSKANREKYKDKAVFPVKLRVLPEFIFNKRAPIVCGVTVEAGILRHGTPLCVPSKENLDVGRVYSIEINNKPVNEAKKGQEVCVRIDPIGSDAPKMYGRHFDHNDLLVSKISRDSIDIMKEHFRDELSKDDWRLVVELKKTLGVF